MNRNEERLHRKHIPEARLGSFLQCVIVTRMDFVVLSVPASAQRPASFSFPGLHDSSVAHNIGVLFRIPPHRLFMYLEILRISCMENAWRTWVCYTLYFTLYYQLRLAWYAMYIKIKKVMRHTMTAHGQILHSRQFCSIAASISFAHLTQWPYSFSL